MDRLAPVYDRAYHNYESEMKDFDQDLKDLFGADQVFEEFKDADLVFVDLDQEYLDNMERPKTAVPSARLSNWLKALELDYPCRASKVKEKLSSYGGGRIFRQLYKWGFFEVAEDFRDRKVIRGDCQIDVSHRFDVHIQLPIRVVELKINNWQKALKQARRRKWWANQAWVAMDEEHIKPALKSIEKFREHGIGLMSLGEEIQIYNQAEMDLPQIFSRKRLWEVNERSWMELHGQEADWQLEYSKVVENAVGNPRQRTLRDVA